MLMSSICISERERLLVKREFQIVLSAIASSPKNQSGGVYAVIVVSIFYIFEPSLFRLRDGSAQELNKLMGQRKSS